MAGTDMHSGIYTYDGSALADSEDVVVVTVNYRTNGQR
jgi:carboxylesterase type B